MRGTKTTQVGLFHQRLWSCFSLEKQTHVCCFIQSELRVREYARRCTSMEICCLKTPKPLLPTVADCSTSRKESIMPVTEAIVKTPVGLEFSIDTNRDVMTVLAQLLSNQHEFFAGVSKQWRNAWGDLPQTTRAITAETYVSQLQWSFDGGLRTRPQLCEHIAEHCGVEIMQCAYANGCVLCDEACFKAVACGRFEMIK